jgi:hypothetical protein
MSKVVFPRKPVVVMLVASASMLILACGDDQFGRKRYPVSGAVSYNGNAVEKGVVTFHSVEPEGSAATGQIENGRYSLTTFSPGDGAIPGKYKVSVTSKTADYAAAEAEFAKKGMPKGTAMPQEFSAKVFKEAKDNIPPKYSLPDTSGLEYTVKEGSNTYDIPLNDG